MYKSVSLPLNEKGFALSFNIESCKSKEILKFYEEFGVVVFENILNEDEIKRTIDDLWT